MNNTTLPDDILYAISCVQDDRDTIDIDSELWHEIGDRIERLFKFYYQLVGFDPNNIRKITLNEID
jgi:hypothetical protein